jgi:hypothetical protein
MNYYKLARYNNEVSDFFRGKNKYFDPDRERDGIHNFSFTSYNLFDYASEIGENFFYKLLDQDLMEYMNEEDFNVKDLSIIIKIIWMYNYFRKEDGLLKNDWKISENLIKKINYFIENINLDTKTCELIDELYLRFNYNYITRCNE